MRGACASRGQVCSCSTRKHFEISRASTLKYCICLVRYPAASARPAGELAACLQAVASCRRTRLSVPAQEALHVIPQAGIEPLRTPWRYVCVHMKTAKVTAFARIIEVHKANVCNIDDVNTKHWFLYHICKRNLCVGLDICMNDGTQIVLFHHKPALFIQAARMFPHKQICKVWETAHDK